jgi:GNAT superfamily N-acetyltransferase
MRIRRSEDKDREHLIGLVAGFRTSLRVFSTKSGGDVSRVEAAAEIDEYDGKGYPVFVAESEDGHLVGYLVCRVDGKTVWAESLFVLPEHRRQGIGSQLFGQAENLAADMGSDTVYNWVHPQNSAVVSFLRRRGYDVLNLIELRRAVRDEKAGRRINVGPEEFRY